MPYVTRNAEGKIVSASTTPVAGAEELAAEDPELRLFIESLSQGADALAQSDFKLIRAIEDVVDLLISKNLICITDLPPAVQEKLLQRRSLRHSLNALKLIGDDDQGFI